MSSKNPAYLFGSCSFKSFLRLTARFHTCICRSMHKCLLSDQMSSVCMQVHVLFVSVHVTLTVLTVVIRISEIHSHNTLVDLLAPYPAGTTLLNHILLSLLSVILSLTREFLSKLLCSFFIINSMELEEFHTMHILAFMICACILNYCYKYHKRLLRLCQHK